MSGSARAWQPSATRATAVARQKLYAAVRTFWRERALLEVEVPVLSACSVTDVHLDALSVPDGLGERQLGWLQTSPESHLKRLVCAGFGDVYSITKSFRARETGTRHNPEFTMLEWYRVGQTFECSLRETLELIHAVAGVSKGRQISWFDLVEDRLGLNPDTASIDMLLGCLPDGTDYPVELSRSELLDLLFSLRVEPHLGGSLTDPCVDVVVDFPASQASQSRIELRDGRSVARRFEGFIAGMECFNGYDELLDANVLAKRMTEDRTFRRQLSKLDQPGDDALLAAMRQGLPPCCGVAMGLDRILMIILGSTSIADVLLFPSDRA